MKIRDIRHGEPYSGRFRLLHGKAEDHWLDRHIHLEYRDSRTLAFLAPARAGEVQETIEASPRTAEGRALLRRLELVSTALIVQVAQIDGTELELTGRAFSTPSRSIPISLAIQLSDTFVEQQIMLHYRRVQDFSSGRDRLKEEFLVPELGGWLFTSGPRDEGFEKGFSLLGRSKMLDVAPDGKGGLIARRLVPFRSRQLETRQVLYMREPLQFTDRTLAGLTQEAALSALQKAVQDSSSWIAGWKQYNTEERRILEERFGVLPDLPYEGVPRVVPANGDELLLEVDLAPTASVSKWRRLMGGDGVAVYARTGEVPTEGLGEKDPPGGNLIGLDSRTRRARIRWEADARPPTDGVLCASLMLEQARLRKREQALLRLESADCALPYLGVLLEAQPEYREIQSFVARPLTNRAKKAFAGHRPTPDQEEAIRVALSTPDIALIMGPPGTGKTRVIQAILAMFNDHRAGAEEEEERSDVLVTSFQHEAVDNAIAGVQFAGIPIDRRGGPRGQDRGAEVIARWCQQLSEQVKKQLPAEPAATRVLLDRIMSLTSHWRQSPGGREGTHRMLNEVRRLSADILTASRLSEIERILAVQVPTHRPTVPLVEEPEDRARIEGLLSAQCVTRESFAQDGPFQARRLRRALGPWLDDLPADVLETIALASDNEISWAREPWHMLNAGCRTIRAVLLDPPHRPDIPEQEVPEEAVEQCLMGVLDDIRESRAHGPDLLREALELFMRDLEMPADVREAVQQYTPVQAVTCGQADSRTLGVSGKKYVVVIADEAARANPLDLLIALVKGRRIVLVGDHRQLPHVLEPAIERSLVKRDDAELREVYQKSLFERLWEFLPRQTELDGISRTAWLTDQFRMHPTIGAFVSKEFYEGRLRSRTTAESRPNRLGLYADRPIAWLDVSSQQGGEERVGSSWQRMAEIRQILAELRRILPALEAASPDFDPDRPDGMVGVIAFYSAQEAALQEALEDPQLGLPSHLRERVRIGTVDAFQGREYEVVLLSTVRSNRQQDLSKRLGFTALPNRLCVAFSRARNVLIVVGDAQCVAGAPDNEQPWSKPMHAFLDLCRSDGYVARAGEVVP